MNDQIMTEIARSAKREGLSLNMDEYRAVYDDVERRVRRNLPRHVNNSLKGITEHSGGRAV